MFSADNSVFTFSMHTANWCWIARAHNRDVELPPHTGDERYLETLRERLPAIVAEFRPDFATYVAGSDPHAGDTLGNLDLSEPGTRPGTAEAELYEKFLRPRDWILTE